MFRYVWSFRSKDGLHSYEEWQNFAVVKTHPYIQIISSIKKKYLFGWERDLRQAWTLEKALWDILTLGPPIIATYWDSYHSVIGGVRQQKKYFLVTLNKSGFDLPLWSLIVKSVLFLLLACFSRLFFTSDGLQPFTFYKNPIEIPQTTSTASRPISIQKPCNLSDLRKQGKKLMK